MRRGYAVYAQHGRDGVVLVGPAFRRIEQAELHQSLQDNAPGLKAFVGFFQIGMRLLK